MAKDVLKQKWYLLGQPWCSSHDAGLTILAGSDDPQKATYVADTSNCIDDENGYDQDVSLARDVAKHIVDLHNASISIKSN